MIKRDSPATNTQLGASIPKGLYRELQNHLGDERIKNAIVAKAIANYLAEQDAPQAMAVRVALAEDELAALVQERKKNRYTASSNVARSALRLLLGLEESPEEFVVRIGDQALIERIEVYRTFRGITRSRLAQEAMDEFVTAEMRRNSRFRDSAGVTKRSKNGRA